MNMNMANKYNYKFNLITIDQIFKLKDELYDRYSIKLNPDQIRPYKNKPDFEDQYKLNWDKFRRLFAKQHGKIRKYSLALSAPFGYKEYEGRFLVTVRLNVKERLNKFDSYRYPSIEYSYYWGDLFDFEKGREVLEDVWGLEFSDEQRKLDLFHRFTNSTVNQEFRDKVSALLFKHDYDAAMNIAVTLVESKLREKCVDAGNFLAKNATGADLAKIAYHPDSGCLKPIYPVASNASEGAMLMFLGFFKYIRNAFGHNATVMGNDGNCVVEFLNLCETLLKIIELSA